MRAWRKSEHGTGDQNQSFFKSRHQQNLPLPKLGFGLLTPDFKATRGSRIMVFSEGFQLSH